jgi:tRNA(Ile)-lysidine synthase
VAFAAEGGSGRTIELGGGVEIARELDRIELREAPPPGAEPPPDLELVIESASPGHGLVRLAGCRYRVRWDRSVVGTGAHRGGDESTVVLPLDDLAFPLRIRARRPGDRMSTPVGTRKLKKILLEARVPPRRRDRLPVLVDAAGRVLWVTGVARAGHAAPAVSQAAPAGNHRAPAHTAGVNGRAGVASEAAFRITIEPGGVEAGGGDG